MHKKIALLIKKIVDESPYEHFTCDVVRTDTDGFWKCYINFDSRKDVHAESLVRLLKPLGMVFGEGLGISDMRDIVKVS